MNLRHILHVFHKDGRELLRDRRTLFVNILLPALLYPLITLFGIQVWQLTRAQKTTPPLIAVIDAPDSFAGYLSDAKDPAATRADGSPTAAPDHEPPLRPRVAVAHLGLRDIALLRDEAKALHRAEAAKDAAPAAADPTRMARRTLLDDLRRLGLAAVVVMVGAGDDQAADTPYLEVVLDDAHPDFDAAATAINHAGDRLERDLILAALKRARLSVDILKPLNLQLVKVAPSAESLRARLAGMIPLLLVIMAVSGAFYPALDLLAGERERGTLESLLSWPVARRDIFLGKLLVTCAAAVISVVLNLSSLAFTIGLAGSQLARAGDVAASLSVGAGVMALSFLVLLPITVTLAAVSLALAGLAASTKEAQNYLTPLLLVVTLAAAVAALPDSRPSLALDLVPITGPVLALKESLRAASLPWLHLALSAAASLALAVVMVSWAVRLLDSESFCYPGLVRAGWGRFRRWGQGPEAPGGLEAMAVYALAVGGFTLGGGFFARLGPVAQIVGPLVGFALMPAMLHCWLGNYPPAGALGLSRPVPGSWWRCLVALPFAVMVSYAFGMLQYPYMPEALKQMGGDETLAQLSDIGGLPLVVLCIAVAPGICEEVLCRGTLLNGLRRSIGDAGAVVLSAFLFAILHLSPFRFLPQFAIGIVLAIIALRSRSIVPGMVLHAGHNTLVMVVSAAIGMIAPEFDLTATPPLDPWLLLAAGIAGLAVALGAFSGLRQHRALPAHLLLARSGENATPVGHEHVKSD